MVRRNHTAFDLCEKAADGSELERTTGITKSKQNEGFHAYDCLGASKSN